MDSLTVSPLVLRSASMSDEMFLGEAMFEWEPTHAHTHQSMPLAQQLSPPEMEAHHPVVKQEQRLQKTPIRQRASSLSQYSHGMFDEDKGLVTPISTAGTPASFWAGQKLEFMTPTPRDDYSTLNTPLATPVPLVPPSPVYDKISPTSGTNPFYCLPMCMRPSTDVLPSPELDFEEDLATVKAKATSAAEEALAQFTEPTRERALSEGDARPDKPFTCTHCPKSFRRMEHLRRHVKIHTKERPFSCDIPGCGRKFSRSDNLKAHMKTHAKPTGRNIYVEGLELEDVQVTPKRRKVE